MKTKTIRLTCVVSALLALANVARAQGTAFTYQGRLNDGVNPAGGTYDLRFVIYDALNAGTQQGSPLTNSAIIVSNGLFTVKLDFGNQFPGANRWLEIAARTNGAGAFTTLTPRQALTASPYAFLAANVPDNSIGSSNLQDGAVVAAKIANSAVGASQIARPSVGSTHIIDDAISSRHIVDGSISASDLADGSVTATKIGNSAVGATQIARPSVGSTHIIDNAISSRHIVDGSITPADLASNLFWSTTGNSGTTPGTDFLGTTDNEALELKVNGQRALRLEYASNFFGQSINVIGGYGGNVVSSGLVGAFIGGGGNSANPNRVTANYATAVGGLNNTASGFASTAMGVGTIASGGYTTTLGRNTTASGEYSTAMGFGTTASGNYSTTMGLGTIASGEYAAAMGRQAKANHSGAFVWADSTLADFASTAANQFLIRAAGGVGINNNNPNGAALAVNGSITASGAVGIGTASPAADLHLVGPDTRLRVQATDTLSYAVTEYVTGGRTYHTGVGGSAVGAGLNGKYYIYDETLGATRLVLDTSGNVGIGTTAPVSALQVVGTVTATAFNPPSDRNLKENFAVVNPREVLDKVAALPISRWNFKGDAATPHVGPMAQDFYAAFGTGTDERHIATVDADGVALAAIQGLNQKLEAEVKSKDVRIAELEKRLAAIEALLQK